MIRNNGRNPQPQTVDQAVTLLLNTLDDEAKEQLRQMEKRDLIRLHFSLGMYIRNQFGL